MEHLLKISEFSYLSGIKRKNLIYYDQIGLLAPERVMSNGYRFYSHRQLETVSVISALQEAGMPICDIKRHLDERTPAALIALFTAQRKKVEEKIHRLECIEAMIDTRLGITRRGLEIDPSAIELHHCAEEKLFAGEKIVCDGTEEELEKAVEAFYILCDAENITYGYPFGTMVARENLLAGRRHLPSRFFFKILSPHGTRPKLSKPAGLYLTAFERSSRDDSQKIYDRLFDSIKTQKLAIVGDSYEEYLLDEVAVKNPDDYILQISIQVEKIR